MNKIINKILTEVSLDNRVRDGIFNIENDIHMEVLREYLFNKGIDESYIKSFSNAILEGKYPERQAFNAKGILVTFPTPEYKQAAIKRGTHFEKDPTKGQSNLFSGNPSQPSSNDIPPAKNVSEPKTNLPVSQASEPSITDTTTTPQGNSSDVSIQPQTTAAPQQTSMSPQTTEPVKEPTELPPPPIPSSKEKEANKSAIKSMLKGDDYMLEQVVNFVRFNAPEYLIKELKEHISINH